MSRPEHPDFMKLSTIILDLDANPDIDKVLEGFVDRDSLLYMASQRAFRVLHIKTLGDLLGRETQVAMLASVYTEGFMMGARFRDART